MTLIPDTDRRGLRRLNVIAGGFHLVSLIVLLVLANGFTIPVTATYETGPPGTTYAAPITLFHNRIAYAIAAFLALSALFHFVVASPTFFPRYAESLGRHRNIFRWVEYSLSSSIMIVLIAQLTGVTDYAALLAIFGVNASMILFGWLQERFTSPGDGQWLPFVFGCIAGVVPWIIVVVNVLSPKGPKEANPPAFVYAIIVTLFLLFNCFALVQLAQYRARGKWANYLRGERTYIMLSFVAKSALAWQIFGSTLAGSK
ncbi:MAG: heliorhodopsin HeR [Solirubrobacteraceae bacterium]